MYGPNVPLMMGINRTPRRFGDRIQPLEIWRQADVDGLSESGRQAADLARADAAQRDPAVPPRRGLGRTGLPGDRPSAGHGRRAAFADPDRADYRGDRGDDAFGRVARRRAQGHPHVPSGARAGSGHGGEHELPEVPALPRTDRRVQPRRRAPHGEGDDVIFWPNCRSTRGAHRRR